MTKNYPLLSIAVAFLFACNRQNPSSGPITPDEIKSHIAVLANDSLMGRKPFTEGEVRTTRYISRQFKQIGLEPGNNGSYFQDVPMVEIKGTPSETMDIAGGKSPITLHNGTDFVVMSRQELPDIDLRSSPLVFAGYGVVAPEYHWNDYAGLNVKGKTVVVLVNDPGFKSGDKTLFKGDTMTYYGRWTYKYEEAARQGAAGVLIVHQTEPASYPWHVVSSSNSGARLYLQQANKHMDRCKVEGWITEDAAKKLFAQTGITGDFRALARKRDFKAIPLNQNVSVTIHNQLKYSTSHNVIGVLKGSAIPNEYVIYTAHWDHFGIGKPDAKGDSIYNGAVDNGDGSASLIAMATAFANEKEKPKRSIIFLAVTGEEQGLLGSEYYATHPIYPLNKTLTDLNMDALGNYGETKDIAITGKGQNDLDDYIEKYAKQDGLTVVGDSRPGAGSYYRSDHFNFAKVGVPALDMNTGLVSKTHEAGWAKKQQDDYVANHYHQPSDNYSPAMDATGMAQIANLLFRLGNDLANGDTFPGWKAGSEFKAVREKSIGK
ncbi:MAG TPA: M28 family metallopeptidase [Mucilaginibacter sp.]|jgi:Zn-dependent M28 family amino/carboxypeptidase|nr:M28 family metallopeptidase [Mucilaginibacter sp.]